MMRAAAFGATTAFLLATLAALATTAGAAPPEGTVYLWVDKNGTPHYEDRPTEGTDAKEMNLHYQLTDPKVLAANAKQKSELDEAARVRDKQKDEDKEKGATAAKQTESERSDNCKAAKDRMEKYDTAHKLYKPLPNGDRQYLSDKEIDAARADARRSVDEWCSK